MIGARPTIMIQARTGSSRLPRKILEDVCGQPLLAWVIGRCRYSRLRGDVVVVTSDLARDDIVAELSTRAGALVHRGSEADVLLRYTEAARAFNSMFTVRITADCPFVDPAVIDEVIDVHARHDADYVCIEGYPEGLGSVELVSLAALERALERTQPSDTYFREHVITYLVDHPKEFDLVMPLAPEPLRCPELHFSVDTESDLSRARRIATFFHPRRDFDIADILSWVQTQTSA